MSVAEGFSLVEAIVATSIVTTAIVSIVHLFAMSLTMVRGARDLTYAAVLASEKMEQLRSLRYSFDGAGSPVTDSSSDLVSPTIAPGGGSGLSFSPPGTLDADVAGYVDYVDAGGASHGGDPGGASYVRRWSVQPSLEHPETLVIFRVLVRPMRGLADRVRASTPGEVRLASSRGRKGP